MAGVVLIVIGMLLVGPAVVMIGGAIWSALVGWLLVDDTEQHAEGQPA